MEVDNRHKLLDDFFRVKLIGDERARVDVELGYALAGVVLLTG